MKVKVISLPYIFQVLYVLCFTRLRYQVSVDRTIGPLVIDCYPAGVSNKHCLLPLFHFHRISIVGDITELSKCKLLFFVQYIKNIKRSVQIN